MISIKEATLEDFNAIWPIFNSVVAAGDTYAYEVDTSKDQAKAIWFDSPGKTYVILEDGKILGSYYLKTNHAGPGKHVCNCGYMVSEAARGKGLATKMCEHSQQMAIELGYKAMQFNFVAASNVGAIRLWEKLGFEIVGQLPDAFDHPSQGLVDALVMYKWLE